MTHFPKSLLVRVFSALVFCTLIAAGGAYAKDIEGDANKGSAATETASGTLKTRQIAVEPATTPSDASPTKTSENAPAPEAETTTSDEQPAADDSDDVTPALAKEPSQPAPKSERRPAYVYVLRHAGTYSNGYDHGYHHYRPAHGYDGDDYESAGYSHDRGYEHCD